VAAVKPAGQSEKSSGRSLSGGLLAGQPENLVTGSAKARIVRLPTLRQRGRVLLTRTLYHTSALGDSATFAINSNMSSDNTHSQRQ
jgi:hypothetical protein